MERNFKVGDIVRIVSFDTFKKRMADDGYNFVAGRNIFTKSGHPTFTTERTNYKGGHMGVILSCYTARYRLNRSKYEVRITSGNPSEAPYGSCFVDEWLDVGVVENFNILD